MWYEEISDKEKAQIFEKRLKHLLQSKVIRSFDEVDIKTGLHKHDIKTVDEVFEFYEKMSFLREIWPNRRLNVFDKVVYAELKTRLNNDGHCTYEHLTEFCQCSEWKLRKTLRKLGKIGYLIRV